jgi:hypothetical protein
MKSGTVNLFERCIDLLAQIVLIASRRRGLVIAGLLVSALVATLVTFKPTPDGVEWRAEPTYMSTSRTYVTQPGFPLGRTQLPGSDPAQLAAPRPRAGEPSFASPDRFKELAGIYTALLQSEQVRRLGSPVPPEDQMEVRVLQDPSTQGPLPLIELATTAANPRLAQSYNKAALGALRDYIHKNVRENGVSPAERVEVQFINAPMPGVLIGGRSLKHSAIAFILGMLITFGLVFLLERRSRRVSESADELLYPPLSFDAFDAVPSNDGPSWAVVEPVLPAWPDRGDSGGERGD